MNARRHAGLLLLGASLTASPAAARPVPPQLFEREVVVGGETVHALCTPGAREVVLLPGAGGRAGVWRPVLERLDGVVGACAYDRLGDAGHPAAPRGWFELLDEMRRTHETLGYQPGYTVVAHSVGGLYARLFAAHRPRDVGGLVLLDPDHEDMAEGVQPGMPLAAYEEWMRKKRLPNADGIRVSELEKRARRSRLPDLPVTVVTATRRPDGAGWDERFLNQAARRVHASILEGITTARHVPAGRSGHDIHLDEPELVAREIERMARLTRGSKR